MPNGGGDCCGTCWFNARNKGDFGYEHADDPEPNYCTIRSVAIENAFWTYCLNHPHHRPTRDPIPIGPIFVDAGGFPYSRKEWRASPDTREVRDHLLNLVRAIKEPPVDEYPASASCDEVVVWQLGEFREARGADELRRIAAFSLDVADGRFGGRRETLVEAAKEALSKMETESER
jgi:hypothetical protein